MFSTFSAVFEALETIEQELQKGVSDKEKEKIIDTLISLRSTMDKCVHYWIKFEEKVSSLQEKHQIELPDTLPESFLDEFTLFDNQSPGSETDPPETSALADTQNTSSQAFPNNSSSGATADPGSYENNLAQYQQCLQQSFKNISEENAIISFRKGLGFWDLALLHDAAKEFEKVTRLEPDFIIGHFFLGISCSYKKEYDRAFQELKLVIALDSDDLLKAISYNTIGSLYADLEEPSLALENFEKASRVKPELKEAYFNQGAVYFNQQRYEQALEAFNRFLEYEPEDWEALLYAGKACGHLEKWDDALTYLKKAYKNNPLEPLITFELGIACRVQEKHENAEVYFRATRRMLSEASRENLPEEGI